MAWIETRRTKRTGEPRYLVRWRDPRTHELEYHGPFHRKEDARSIKIEIERQIDRGEYGSREDRRVPLAQYLKAAIDGDFNIGGNTRYGLEVNWRKWIRDSELGKTELGKVSATQLREFLAAIPGNGSRLNVYSLLSKGFQQAFRDGILTRNPLVGVRRPPKKRAKKVDPLPVEAIELLRTEYEPRWRIAVDLGGYCGLRASEVGGLRRQDVDFLRQRIRVGEQTAIRVGGRRLLKAGGKSESSSRTIRVPGFVVERISEHVKEFGTAPDGRLLQTRDGGLVESIRLNDECQEAAKAAGLGRVNFHSLRHTCASILIEQGTHPKKLQSYLGHSNIGVTMDIYGHLFDSVGDDVAEKMEAAYQAGLGGAKVIGLPVS